MQHSFFLGVSHRFQSFGDGSDGAGEYPGYFSKIRVGMLSDIIFKLFRAIFLKYFLRGLSGKSPCSSDIFFPHPRAGVPTLKVLAVSL